MKAELAKLPDAPRAYNEKLGLGDEGMNVEMANMHLNEQQ